MSEQNPAVELQNLLNSVHLSNMTDNEIHSFKTGTKPRDEFDSTKRIVGTFRITLVNGRSIFCYRAHAMGESILIVRTPELKNGEFLLPLASILMIEYTRE
ncbi:hypothetical protein [Pseudomonas sp. LS-2]|uniref:hypothetical protein n=1 Tax=Pseudomonas sp. LS-2 TaxID=2315859 RepID=UPI000E74CDAE|nr:hypothetical protein [Pseudomonas sp. LS-2]RJX72653.1 hypothetical protein D3M70_31115 [Pseudomonas sp. LS-2]